MLEAYVKIEPSLITFYNNKIDMSKYTMVLDRLGGNSDYKAISIYKYGPKYRVFLIRMLKMLLPQVEDYNVKKII